MNEEERFELIRYRLSRAKDTLQEVKIHIKNKLWNTAINRIYYSCFYAVSSLLLSRQITAQTHSGVRQMFGLHFVKTNIISRDLGKFYTDIFDKRITGDYDDFVEFSKDDVINLYETAESFVLTIERVIAEDKKHQL
jgi:uncharacterized protein (UPF0332 family)